VTTLAELFDALIARKGSDLHLGAGQPPLARVRGDLVHLRTAPCTQRELESWLFGIIDAPTRSRFEHDKDLDFAHAHGDKARFRASYFYKTTGLGAVFRVIPSKILTLEELRAPPVLRQIAEERRGLALVTGPTGSGKSTTLAAMLRHINEARACHILTIEDPVEFVHASIKARITQREIGKHAPDFPTAMKNAGREDADVILVGELRNAETMALALRLASFGVLVFATVHTNSAPATVDRFVNSFPAEDQAMIRGLLAESLIAVVAQELVPSADGKGRVAVHEVLRGTSGLASMIREGKTHQIPNVMQGGGQLGMQTMDMALAGHVRSGALNHEDAATRARDKEAFLRMIRR
jgi:twitching motility protein PilT